MLENDLPIRFEEYGLISGSGGDGRTRGGLGLTRAFRLEAPAGVFASNLERFKFRPYGLEGGEPGQPGSLSITRAATGETEQLPSKVSDLAVSKGDLIRLCTAGGGGYGPSSERTEASRAWDRAEGYVKP